MNWQLWALGSALFAAITAKIGVSEVDCNLATAIRQSSSGCSRERLRGASAR